jgi:hypothetical protein
LWIDAASFSAILAYGPHVFGIPFRLQRQQDLGPCQGDLEVTPLGCALLFAAANWCPSPIGSDTLESGSSVSWHEPFGFDTVERTLQIDRINAANSAVLRLTVRSKYSDGTEQTRFEDTLEGPFRSWELALPIAVSGSASPQIVATLRRPNWLDIVIFSLDGDGTHRAFSFSCRDYGAVKWNVSKGRLLTLETFDRYETVPAKLESTEPKGMRWQLHDKLKFEPSSSRWREVQRKWELFKFGEPAPGRPIMKSSDCDFLFRSMPTVGK